MINGIKSLLAKVDPLRANAEIAGQNPNLPRYKAWYRGKTEFHRQLTIIEGEKKYKDLYYSGFGKLGASTWADQFLNEGTTITVPDDKGNELLQMILKDQKVISKLNPFAEKYFALGLGTSVVMPSRITFNDETNTLVADSNASIKISFLDATRTYPITVDDGTVTEIAIVKMATNKATIQIHMLNEAGNYVIAEVDGKVIQSSYTADYNTLKVWDTKSSVPLFQTWYPNACDNEDLDNQLGCSILNDATIQWIKAFDIAFDKFVTEFKNGGKKRFLSADLTYVDEDGTEKRLPLGEEDVYLPKSVMDGAPNMIHEQVTNIRAESFIRGLSFYASMVGRYMGLGEDAFEIDGNSGRPIQTATAAILKKNSAQRNVRKNEHLAEDNLKAMCMAIKQVYNSCISENSLNYELDDIEILFDDNIIEDTTSKKELELKEVAAGAMSLAEYRSHWYDEDYDSAVEFLQDKGMLINTYLPAFSAGVMTADMFIDLAFGPNCKYKADLKAKLEQMLMPIADVNYMNEESEEDDEEED